ncbi:hypothetical protein FGO68_gene4454 [Halteria grandinella]|uniref:C2 domain-containing protein n=1 Tax=Halteria grandinella TaxID=5974 RepID=A0A8J8NUC7_HALGN|nr:hypothetical protein FGO68_gene4454 [Halteria grandinella]
MEGNASSKYIFNYWLINKAFRMNKKTTIVQLPILPSGGTQKQLLSKKGTSLQNLNPHIFHSQTKLPSKPQPQTLKMKIVEGRLFRNTELFGQMDPFLVIQHDGHSYKTKVIQAGGKTPVWNETFEIAIDGPGDKITIKCYDEDLIMDDFVGEGQFNARALCPIEEGIHKEWYLLKYEGKKAAEVLIETEIVHADHQFEAKKVDSEVAGDIPIEEVVNKAGQDTLQVSKGKEKDGVKTVETSPKIAKVEKKTNSKDLDDIHNLEDSHWKDDDAAPQKNGVLKILIVRGRLFRDTEIMGHMDPFIQLTMNGQVKKTSAIDDGGKRPVWNQSFEYVVNTLDDLLEIKCYDEDVFTNDLVGECSIKVGELCGNDLEHQSAIRKWITLFYDKKKSAEIQIDVKYVPPAALQRFASDELPEKPVVLPQITNKENNSKDVQNLLNQVITALPTKKQLASNPSSPTLPQVGGSSLSTQESQLQLPHNSSSSILATQKFRASILNKLGGGGPATPQKQSQQNIQDILQAARQTTMGRGNINGQSPLQQYNLETQQSTRFPMMQGQGVVNGLGQKLGSMINQGGRNPLMTASLDFGQSQRQMSGFGTPVSNNGMGSNTNQMGMQRMQSNYQMTGLVNNSQQLSRNFSMFRKSQIPSGMLYNTMEPQSPPPFLYMVNSSDKNRELWQRVPDRF